MLTFDLFTWCVLCGTALVSLFGLVLSAMTCHYVWSIRELIARHVPEPVPRDSTRKESEPDAADVPSFQLL
jgi:hypothetical protein